MTQEENSKTNLKSETDKLEPKLGIFEPEVSELKTELNKTIKLTTMNMILTIIILCLVCYKLGREHGEVASKSQVSFNPTTYLIT